VPQKTILVAPEMVDLAESHRMASFARAFHELGHEVVVLGDGRYDYLFDDIPCRRVSIEYDSVWMGDEHFRRLHNIDAYGMNWIAPAELSTFIAAEVDLLRSIRPDVAITGFRPSIRLSTRVMGVPLVWVHAATVSNPYFQRGLATAPHGLFVKRPWMALVPPRLRNWLANVAPLHIPLKIDTWNKVALKWGVGRFESTLSIFQGDYNLLSDAPELFPEFGKLTPDYDFCGPLLLDHPIPMPDSLRAYQRTPGRPVIFFSMGSSGSPELFRSIIAAFADQPYDVFVATTTIIDKAEIAHIPANVIVEAFFPALDVAAMADVAVIHGGQGTVYSALFAGTPFVGVPMFSEQQYNLEVMARQGCGLVLRRDRCTSQVLLGAVRRVLADTSFKQNAQRVQGMLIKYRAQPELFPPRVGAEKVIAFLAHI
jgi:UDP:flavonoid glycosyltransferase YjiC (YdhE family)